jgi:hypothetical protein
MPLPSVKVIETFPNTNAWRKDGKGRWVSVACDASGADLHVDFVIGEEEEEHELHLSMRAGSRINNVFILPMGGLGQEDPSVILIKFDSFIKSVRFVACHSLFANQQEGKLLSLFPPPRPAITAPRVQQSQEVEEEEVDEDVAHGNDDNGSAHGHCERPQ